MSSKKVAMLVILIAMIVMIASFDEVRGVPDQANNNTSSHKSHNVPPAPAPAPAGHTKVSYNYKLPIIHRRGKGPSAHKEIRWRNIFKCVRDCAKYEKLRYTECAEFCMELVMIGAKE